MGLVARRTIAGRALRAMAGAALSGAVAGCGRAALTVPGSLRAPLLLYMPALYPARTALEEGFAHEHPLQRQIQFQQQFAAGAGQTMAGELLSLSASTQPLDPYLRARNWTPDALLPGLIDALTENGTIYGLPLLLELYALGVHPAAARAAGLTVPATALGVPDLTQWAAAARLPAASGSGGAYTSLINGWQWASSRVWGAFVQAYGGTLQDGGQIDLEGEPAKAGLRALVQLLEALKAGWSTPASSLLAVVDLDIPVGPDPQTKWFAFPALTVGTRPAAPAYPQGAGVTSGQADSEADAEALVEFMLWLYAPAQQRLLMVYGWPPIIRDATLLQDWERGSLLSAPVRAGWTGQMVESASSAVVTQALLPWELRGDGGMSARRLVGTMIAEAAMTGTPLTDAMIHDVSQALGSAQAAVQQVGDTAAFQTVQAAVAQVQERYGWNASVAGEILSPEE